MILVRKVALHVAVNLAIVSLGGFDALAVSYVATILPGPAAATSTKAYAVSGSALGGDAFTASGWHAALWTDPNTSGVDLNPTGFQWSDIYAMSNGTQVGDGKIPNAGPWHALMWSGSAASAIDLHPLGYSESTARAVDGDTQGGWATLPGSNTHHAMIWKGSGASAVDLSSPGNGAEVLGISGDTEVGYRNFSGPQHATLWKGTAASNVDLHPSAWDTSFATGVAGNVQVGAVFAPNASFSHAALWTGTAASFLDLNPAGFSRSQATATNGALEAGFGLAPQTGSAEHALLWSGTAASYVDLHQYLSGLGRSFLTSHAMSIAPNGAIVGYAGGTSPGDQVAIVWTPVPEPTTCALVGAGHFLALLLVARRRLP